MGFLAPKTRSHTGVPCSLLKPPPFPWQRNQRPSLGQPHSRQTQLSLLQPTTSSTTEQPHLPRPENGQSRSPSPQTHGSRFSQQVFPSSAAEQPPAAATTQQRPPTGSPWSCHRPPETEEEETKNLQRCSRSEQGEGRGADLKKKLKQTCLLHFGCFAGNGVAHSRQEGEERVWQCGCGCFSNNFSCQNACQ